ncbi:hypothetical protein COBT_002509 [Conglomerata obtusa]
MNIEKNLYDYIIQNITVLENICFKSYVFENFLANRTREIEDLYKIMRKSYYNFIRENTEVLNTTRAIVKFYIFCNYLNTIKDYDFSFSENKNVCNIYNVNELTNDANPDSFIFNTYMNNERLNYKIGIYMHPAFENLDTHKIIKFCTVRQNIQSTLADILWRKNEDLFIIKYHNVASKLARPVYVDIIYSQYDEIDICRMLSVSFWLNHNFYSHLLLYSYVDNASIFELASYLLDISKTQTDFFNENYKINIPDSTNTSCNPDVVDTSNLIIYTNYSIDEKSIDSNLSFCTVNDALIESFPNKFGTKHFVLHISCKHVNHYFPLVSENNDTEVSYIFKLCIIIYKEIANVFKQLGFKSKENILNLYTFLGKTFNEIDIYKKNFDICLKILYKKNINKFLITNLFATSFQIITNENITELNKYIGDKIFDTIDYTDLTTEHIEAAKIWKPYVEINPNKYNNSAKKIKLNLPEAYDSEFTIFSLIISNVIDAILTAGIIHTTEENYFYELVKLNLKLSIPKLYQTSPMLTVNPQYTQYNSINFMDMVNETIAKRGSSLKEKKNIFYYDFFYINFKDKGEISNDNKTDIKEKMKKILNFSPGFLKKIAIDYVNSIFILNVVYIDYSNKVNTISSCLKEIYAINHVLLHKILMEITNEIKNELPKLFVIKHNGIPIDNNLKTIWGDRVVIIDDMQ